jgi:hypothetical protein
MSKLSWFKGNLHTHTTESDGDAPPEHVASWYHEHSYDFLVITDHNHLTVLDDAAGSPGKWPLLIPGEEVTVRLWDNTAPVHINGIGIDRLVEPAHGESVTATIQENVDNIRAAGGLASINHPNYKWVVNADDIASVEGAWAMEIFNGHPFTNDTTAGNRPGGEDIWDLVLSTGRRICGVATDDSHHYVAEFSPLLANPGRGWVVVHSEKGGQENILLAMSEGDYYASTGVVLDDLKVAADEIVVAMNPYETEEFTTVFSGLGGEVLEEIHGHEARFKPPEGVGYVRATVGSSRGSRAWSQPLYL